MTVRVTVWRRILVDSVEYATDLHAPYDGTSASLSAYTLKVDIITLCKLMAGGPPWSFHINLLHA